jgi:hypothetical protein
LAARRRCLWWRGRSSRRYRNFAQGIGDIAGRWVKGAALFAGGIALLPLAVLRGRSAVVGRLMVAARGVGHIAAEFNLLYEEYR